MKTTIENEKENPYMERKELAVKLEHDKEATPTKAALQKEISTLQKKDVENVEIVNIFSEHGIGASNAKVYIWNEKKVKDLSKVDEKEGAATEAPPKEEKPTQKEETKKEEEKPTDDKEVADEKKEEAPKKPVNEKEEAKVEEKKE
jgi:ribosomal protein S24E